MAKAAKKDATESTRTDGRKAMLVYLDPELIQLIKDKAAANDQKAWQLVENAVGRALNWKRKKT